MSAGFVKLLSHALHLQIALLKKFFVPVAWHFASGSKLNEWVLFWGWLKPYGFVDFEGLKWVFTRVLKFWPTPVFVFFAQTRPVPGLQYASQLAKPGLSSGVITGRKTFVLQYPVNVNAFQGFCFFQGFLLTSAPVCEILVTSSSVFGLAIKGPFSEKAKWFGFRVGARGHHLSPTRRLSDLSLNYFCECWLGFCYSVYSDSELCLCFSSCWFSGLAPVYSLKVQTSFWKVSNPMVLIESLDHLKLTGVVSGKASFLQCDPWALLLKMEAAPHVQTNFIPCPCVS